MQGRMADYYNPLYTTESPTTGGILRPNLSPQMFRSVSETLPLGADFIEQTAEFAHDFIPHS